MDIKKILILASLISYPAILITYELFNYGLLALIVLLLIPTVYLIVQFLLNDDYIVEHLIDYGQSKKSFSFLEKKFSGCFFPDLYFSVINFAESNLNTKIVKSSHNYSLNTILHDNINYYPDKLKKTSNNKSWKISCDEEKYIPEEVFVVLKNQDNTETETIIRIKYVEYDDETNIEIASQSEKRCERIMNSIDESAKVNSIYKNKLLSIEFDEAIKDEDGYYDSKAKFKVLFLPESDVTREKIVIEEKMESILDRTIFNYHKNYKKKLSKHIQGKQGILFYGPAGNGKTYTCKYIANTLMGITKIILAGKNLNRIKSIFNFISKFQPAMLILEDVDLVFSSREINLYSSSLGDFMDILDGFQDNKEIIYILTTNAINRLEEAIKNRPGRINQCILFDNPNKELKMKYLHLLLDEYKCTNLNIEKIADDIGSVSQAFIKELVRRAIQICLESTDNLSDLENSHFTIAYNEITEYRNKYSESIIGFNR